MNRVSAFPTVQWLETRSPDRPPVGAPRAAAVASKPFSRPSGTACGTPAFGAASPGRRLADRLERMVAPGVRVAVDTWVSTPNGDQEVDVLVSSGPRRVAIVFTGRYEHRAAEMDAVRLVYGRADVLLRVRGELSNEALYSVLLALVVEKPGWFTAVGRVKAGRWATPLAAIALSMAPTGRCVDGVPYWDLGAHRISRMRMRCASDWVRLFEAALGFSVRGT